MCSCPLRTLSYELSMGSPGGVSERRDTRCRAAANAVDRLAEESQAKGSKGSKGSNRPTHYL